MQNNTINGECKYVYVRRHGMILIHILKLKDVAAVFQLEKKIYSMTLHQRNKKLDFNIMKIMSKILSYEITLKISWDNYSTGFVNIIL